MKKFFGIFLFFVLLIAVSIASDWHKRKCQQQGGKISTGSSSGQVCEKK